MFAMISLISPVDVEFVGLFSPIIMLAGFFVVVALLLVLVLSFFIFLGRLITSGTNESKDVDNEKQNKDSAIGFALKNKNIRSE